MSGDTKRGDKIKSLLFNIVVILTVVCLYTYFSSFIDYSLFFTQALFFSFFILYYVIKPLFFPKLPDDFYESPLNLKDSLIDLSEALFIHATMFVKQYFDIRVRHKEFLINWIPFEAIISGMEEFYDASAAAVDELTKLFSGIKVSIGQAEDVIVFLMGQKFYDSFIAGVDATLNIVESIVVFPTKMTSFFPDISLSITNAINAAIQNHPVSLALVDIGIEFENIQNDVINMTRGISKLNNIIFELLGIPFRAITEFMNYIAYYFLVFVTTVPLPNAYLHMFIFINFWIIMVTLAFRAQTLLNCGMTLIASTD